MGSDLHFPLYWVWAALAAILGKEEFIGGRGGGQGDRDQPFMTPSRESPLPSAVPGSIQSAVSKGDE